MDIIVVGCGVIGLSSAIRLLERGHRVRIVARDLPPDTTSNVAAAIWYIYAARPLERAQRWARLSLAEFQRLRADPDSGVSSLTIRELLRDAGAELWWRGLLDTARPIPPENLPDGYAAGYVYDVPLIETPLYMPYLMRRFEQLGGHVTRREIESLAELATDTALIVNCSGVWARHVADDPRVYPIRGQVVRVAAPAVQAGWMDEHDPVRPTYLFPRRDACVLGGTAEIDNWSLTPDPEESRRIIERCARLEPALRDAPVVGAAVGLRPGRDEIRLEIEHLTATCAVIHNYGHGGAGFTLSWGCADDVAALADAYLRERR